MAATKKSATMTLVTDLMVKLSNLFKDCYLIRNKILVAGNTPSDKILGTLMCTLEERYKEALTTLIGKGGCFYIASVQDTKKYLQEQKEWEPTEEIKHEIKKYIVSISDTERLEEVTAKVVSVEERFNPETGKIHWWQCIGTNEELVDAIFNMRAIFDMPISSDEGADGTVVTISKQLLPLVTEKNIQNAYIGTPGKEDNDELMEVMLDFRFTHFRVMIIYKVVVLPADENQ